VWPWDSKYFRKVERISEACMAVGKIEVNAKRDKRQRGRAYERPARN
jgi:hypothetical protein